MATDFPLPPVGEGLIEVELVRWLVGPGDAVGRGQPLAEVMSDKATMEVPSPFAGTVAELRADPGTKVAVGQVVLTYTAGAGSPAAAPPAPAPAGPTDGNGKLEPAPPPPKSADGAKVAAAPSVRLLARRLGVDLAAVRGSGPGGRVLVDDLAPHVRRPAADAPPAAAKPAGPHGLDLGRPGRVKIAGVRRKIADNMAAAKRHIPHFAYVDECDVTDLVRLRAQLKDPLAAAGVKLTYVPFVLKAVARALKAVPVVNSTYDDAAEELTTHARCDIGLAVSAAAGLLVPVVRDVDKKDVAALAAEVERVSASARAGKLRPDDLRGGTFTVSSIGGIGGLISTPIVNRPEVGILAVGKIVKRPVYGPGGDLRPADMMYLSFSFDHRVVDGAVGATFGNAVVRELERPAALLLPDRPAGPAAPAA